MDERLMFICSAVIYILIAILVRKKVYRDIKRTTDNLVRIKFQFEKQVESRAKGESFSIGLLWPIMLPIWLLWHRRQIEKEFLMYDTMKFIFR
ncbi:MAG TPA: hypothetical protein ENH35_03930 [Candidatus Moranbacteria bacterium]|nr:hypothetical protein [Candidatus Moranbacteria bacterium]HDZ85668.1 hypothetical protein [Candidatus Moranbacteria bacterium]